MSILEGEKNDESTVVDTAERLQSVLDAFGLFMNSEGQSDDISNYEATQEEVLFQYLNFYFIC